MVFSLQSSVFFNYFSFLFPFPSSSLSLSFAPKKLYAPPHSCLVVSSAGIHFSSVICIGEVETFQLTPFSSHSPRNPWALLAIPCLRAVPIVSPPPSLLDLVCFSPSHAVVDSDTTRSATLVRHISIGLSCSLRWTVDHLPNAVSTEKSKKRKITEEKKKKK